jgi:putative Mg2+ transporter-C (MgtC) family protein
MDQFASSMPVLLSAHDALGRLALTVLAGLALGFDRSEHGKAAGLRTTLLVCLAASVAMMQVNLLLSLEGRSSSSFVMNDLMRLPLGILTGVGFIGGGAIMRRDDLVRGVTTAATLWLATVVGLCIGGGQLLLGIAATMVGLAGLWGLKPIEAALRQQTHASLQIEVDEDGPDTATLQRRITDSGLSIARMNVTLEQEARRRTLVFQVKRMQKPTDFEPPSLVEVIARSPGVVKTSWQDLR